MDRDLRIAAYVDGELAAADRAAFEAELASDAALAAEVELQARLRARLAAAYAPILDEPVPPRLTAAASAANDAGPRRFGLAQMSAMAACLAVGVLVGRLALPQWAAPQQGLPPPRGELARTLDSGLAADAGPVRVSLTFRDREGAYCRTFTDAPEGVAGVACRRRDRWETRTLTAWAPAAGSQYRTAGAETPPEVLAAVEALIAGEPLDAAGEADARARGWRR